MVNSLNTLNSLEIKPGIVAKIWQARARHVTNLVIGYHKVVTAESVRTAVKNAPENIRGVV
jgi:hypothetical protein